MDPMAYDECFENDFKNTMREDIESDLDMDEIRERAQQEL